METHELDVLVVGGGLVGCSLALALAPLGLSMAVVDAPERAPIVASDPRKLALAAASLNALGALGVLARLPQPPTPIRRIHASREGDFGQVRIEAAEFDREALGGVVLAGDLGAALQASMAAAGIPLLAGRAEAAGLDGDARLATIRHADGRSSRCRARLVVAADGTASPWRQAAGIGAERHDYGQTLVVTSLRMDAPPDGTAFERLTAKGPCALLPMAGARHGALCGVASGEVAHVLALDDAGFREYFQQRFGWRAGRVRDTGPRSAWPLQRVVAERLVDARLVLVGNAAQTLHPIGAQGFNLGLRDALSLVDAIEAGAGGDPGAAAVLGDHVERRREDRAQTLAFSDGLARFSAGEGLLHHLARSLGLVALGADAGLRAAFASGAMGFRGRVPRLAREAA